MATIGFTGRVDNDVLNVSGHRMGTAEVESALVLHANVAEAAVVGYPHDIKVTGYLCLCHADEMVQRPSDDLRKELVALCVKEIGAIAKPDVIRWSSGAAEDPVGDIMRRIYTQRCRQ